MAGVWQQPIKRLLVTSLSLLLFLGADAQAEAKTGEAGPALPVKSSAVRPVSTQQQEAAGLYKKIFELSLEKNKAGYLEKRTELYGWIIQNCPDAPLAQESYFKLIELFFNEYTPPLKEKATELFAQFKSRYPDSRAVGVVKYAVAKGLFATKSWEDLVQLESSAVEDYFDTGKIDSPLSLFYYSEAKYNLDDFEAAGKGYSALVENFPDTLVAQPAQKKMVRIDQFRN